MTGNAALIRIRERNAGLLLIAAAGMALLIANSGFGESFHHFLETRLGPTLPRFGQISLHQWVADGLMAVFFLLVTGADPALIRGWAIPSATDIAFAIGVLALLGRRSSPSLKILLVTIAIVDDIGAVIIIALVYTSDLSFSALALSLLIVGAMVGMNRRNSGSNFCASSGEENSIAINTAGKSVLVGQPATNMREPERASA